MTFLAELYSLDLKLVYGEVPNFRTVFMWVKPDADLSGRTEGHRF